MRRPLSTFIDATVALALFGCIPVVVKYTSANPWTIGIVRLVIATGVMAVVTALKGQLRGVGRGELRALLPLGVLFFGHWATYHRPFRKLAELPWMSAEQFDGANVRAERTWV